MIGDEMAAVLSRVVRRSAGLHGGRGGRPSLQVETEASARRRPTRRSDPRRPIQSGGGSEGAVLWNLWRSQVTEEEEEDEGSQ